MLEIINDLYKFSDVFTVHCRRFRTTNERGDGRPVARFEPQGRQVEDDSRQRVSAGAIFTPFPTGYSCRPI